MQQRLTRLRRYAWRRQRGHGSISSHSSGEDDDSNSGDSCSDSDCTECVAAARRIAVPPLKPAPAGAPGRLRGRTRSNSARSAVPHRPEPSPVRKPDAAAAAAPRKVAMQQAQKTTQQLAEMLEELERDHDEAAGAEDDTSDAGSDATAASDGDEAATTTVAGFDDAPAPAPPPVVTTSAGTPTLFVSPPSSPRHMPTTPTATCTAAALRVALAR